MSLISFLLLLYESFGTHLLTGRRRQEMVLTMKVTIEAQNPSLIKCIMHLIAEGLKYRLQTRCRWQEKWYQFGISRF
ncbi:hypothetical protein MKW98_016682 [Papaver atlanticum]|uniref:Secreted protein n=1 Tax=Papaver atlanticum TaxID=357466 RepID=A0AAD4SR23_9MAGN|nr:hypothetical protein MKW98_016682 [Papaver atlanticum]